MSIKSKPESRRHVQIDRLKLQSIETDISSHKSECTNIMYKTPATSDSATSKSSECNRMEKEENQPEWLRREGEKSSYST